MPYRQRSRTHRSQHAKNVTRATHGLDSDRLSCHSLRHTFATLALKGGAPLEQVQAACRHVLIQTTMVYAHNLDRVADGAERYVGI
ncbi:MAG: tyrosine-type recombinase/integrase [Candidatus Sumerlaeota bacterium]|nr:tyrosine-type recombinase/integrase [Candidatus Sumerlaeota bacterium]